MSRRMRRGRPLRVVLALAVASALVLVLYLVALNVAVRTLARNALSKDPAKLAVTYRDAYAYLPSRIQLDGLVVRGRDSSVEWTIHVDHCEFSLSIPALARRKFHADRVRARGVTLRLRREESEPHPRHDAFLPDIAGFATPPLRDIGPPRSQADGKYSLWEVRLRDVVAEDVREVWIDEIRSTGDMRVEGTWLFKPLRWLDLGRPAVVVMRDLDVSHGDESPFAKRAHGRLEVTIGPYDVRAVKGLALLRQLSVHGTLDGNADLHEVSSWIGPNGLSFGGESTVHAFLDLERGRWQRLSSLTAESADARIDGARWSMKGPVTLRADVEPGRAGGALRVDAQTADALLLSGRRLLARVRRADVHAGTDELSVDRPPVDARATLAFDVLTPSVEAWSTLLRSPALFQGGASAAGTARASLADRRVDLTAKVSFAHLGASVGRNSLDTSLAANVVLQATDRPRVAIEASAHVDRLELRARERSAQGRLVVPALDARAELGRTARDGVRGRVDVNVPCTAPAASYGEAAYASPNAKLRISLGGLAACGRGAFRVGPFAATGQVDVSAAHAEVRWSDARLGGRLAIHVRASSGARPGETNVSGSDLALENQQAATPWGLHATLVRSTVQGRDPRFIGSVQATTNDGQPFANLVAEKTPVVAWLFKAMTRGPARGEAKLVVRRDGVELHGLEATSGALDARAEILRRRGTTRGATLLHLGPLHVAAGIGDFAHPPVLFGADSWYRSAVDAIHVEGARRP